jgi:GNAT superfamily N-acetyltransferase
MRLWVEAWPTGGYVVRTDGSPAPLSRHDTEEEAEQRMAAYERGLSRAGEDGERVTLRDGSEALVHRARPIEPPGAAGAAVVAVDPGSGDLVGVARCVPEPARPDAARAAIAVVDPWQGRGLGSLLLRRLGALAAEQGITRFTTRLTTPNTAMVPAFERLGTVRVHDTADGATAIEVELPVAGPGVRATLRSAATGHVTPAAGDRALVVERGRTTDRPGGRLRM